MVRDVVPPTPTGASVPVIHRNAVADGAVVPSITLGVFCLLGIPRAVAYTLSSIQHRQQQLC